MSNVFDDDKVHSLASVEINSPLVK